MKKKILGLFLLTISSAAFAEGDFKLESLLNKNIENKLQSFSTDGCSKFPDGYPGSNPTQWRNCCIAHDIAYWQGGTAEQRKTADANLDKCVTSTGANIIGSAMYYGVRFGGIAGLPMSWHWGYGWIINRGYNPLSESEQAQVNKLVTEIPQDQAKLTIATPNAFRERLSLTGDKCIDIAVVSILQEFGHPFQIQVVSEALEANAIEFYTPTFTKLISIKTDACSEPFEFKFKLSNETDCLQPMSEMVASNRISLANMKKPKDICK